MARATGAHAPLARPGLHPRAIDPHTAFRRLVEAFEEVLDLRHHLLVSHGLGAWSTSIIIARWKCATAPATAVIVSERIAVAGDMGELIEEGVRNGTDYRINVKISAKSST